jgi:hypothetical protein
VFARAQRATGTVAEPAQVLEATRLPPLIQPEF